MDHRADPKRHSFLHTPECNKLWVDFVECKNKHYILKYLDFCSDRYSAVLNCFKLERRQKAELNHKIAQKDRKERLKAIREKVNRAI